MRYIKKIGDIVEYSGVSLGGSRWYEALGWTPYDGTLPASRLDIIAGVVVELPPASPPPVLISKLKLKRKLEELGVWDAFKSALSSSGFWEDFSLAVNLSTNDDAFKLAINSLANLIENLNIDELIADCVWEGSRC